MKSIKTIKVYSTAQFPCQWDDLVIKEKKKKKLIATIYSKKEAEKDNLGFGIKKARDNIYDLVVDASEINNQVVRDALQDLEKRTHKKYKFFSEKTNEDRIIDYANKLIKYGEKFKNKNGDYDFSQVKIPYEKNLVIRSLIGEILYEAITYKNPKGLKSLETTINLEIKELLKKENS